VTGCVLVSPKGVFFTTSSFYYCNNSFIHMMHPNGFFLMNYSNILIMLWGVMNLICSQNICLTFGGHTISHAIEGNVHLLYRKYTESGNLIL